MASRFGSRISSTFPVVCTATPSAKAAPIVFDFEDGLHGWELHGSGQRVQTQVLGGEWAFFGDELVGVFDIRTFISMETDLTPYNLGVSSGGDAVSP
jgi:hypothetical protein